MSKVSYVNKETLVPLPGVETKNKVSAADMNEIKTSINALYDFHPVTYAQLLTLANTSKLDPGRYYKITDRGDRGIILQALSGTLLNRTGIRLMLCPKKALYDYDPSSTSLGVWRNHKGRYRYDTITGGIPGFGTSFTNGTGTTGSGHTITHPYAIFRSIEGPGFLVGDTLTELDAAGVPTGVSFVLMAPPVAIGNTAVWGGSVWKNKTGYPGSPAGGSDDFYALDPAVWERIPKTDPVFYEVVVLNVEYDITQDYISGQWDNQGNSVRMPYAIFDAFGPPANPADLSDWNQVSETLVFQDIKTVLGFFNNDPMVGSLRLYRNIVAGGLAGNDCHSIQSVTCNVRVDLDASESDRLAVISNNKCTLITDVYQTGGINDVPNTIDVFSQHTDNESFAFQHSFEIDPIIEGQTVWKTVLPPLGSMIISMTAVGSGLPPSGPIVISVDLEEQPGYLEYPANLYETGRSASSPSIKTSIRHCKVGIRVTGGDLMEGSLKVSGTYL